MAARQVHHGVPGTGMMICFQVSHIGNLAVQFDHFNSIFTFKKNTQAITSKFENSSKELNTLRRSFQVARSCSKDSTAQQSQKVSDGLSNFQICEHSTFLYIISCIRCAAQSGRSRSCSPGQCAWLQKGS